MHFAQTANMLLSSSETVLSVRRGSSLGQQKTYQVKNKNKKFTSSDEVHSQSLSERYLPCASPVSCLITQAIDYYPDYVCPGFIIWFLFFFFLKKRCPISVTVQQQDITKDIPVYILRSESCLTASGLFVTWKKTQPSHTFAIITTLRLFIKMSLNFSSRVSYLLRLWGDLHSLFSWYLNVSNSSVPLSTAPTLWVSRRWSYLGLS